MRIPAPLKRRLEDAALQNRKSLSAEIVARLAKSLELDPAPYEPKHSTPSEEAIEALALAKENAAQIAAITAVFKARGILD